MDKVYLGVIVVLVLLIAYLLFQPSPLRQEDKGIDAVAESIKSLYELQYESPAQIAAKEETFGVYRIVMNFTDFDGQQKTQGVFVTKDGKLLTNQYLLTENYRAFLENQKKFIECMVGKNLHVLGQRNDTGTLQQFSLLGTYSYKLFVSCDGENEAACRNLGVTRYPATIYNNTLYNNIYPPDVFANLTECALP